MKIDDLSITLFAWNDIPPHSYLGRGPFDPAGQPNRTGELGLVTIRTDDGIEGHSFLGMGTSMGAPALLRMLKPIVMGRDPLAREQLYQEMLERRLGRPALGRRRRRRCALGHRRQGGGGADPPAARHVPGEAAGLRQLRAAA